MLCNISRVLLSAKLFLDQDGCVYSDEIEMMRVRGDFRVSLIPPWREKIERRKFCAEQGTNLLKMPVNSFLVVSMINNCTLSDRVIY